MPCPIWNTAFNQPRLGNIFYWHGSFEKALEELRGGGEIVHQMVREGHQQVRQEEARAWRAIGDVLRDQRDLPEAVAEYRRAAAIFKELIREGRLSEAQALPFFNKAIEVSEQAIERKFFHVVYDLITSCLNAVHTGVAIDGEHLEEAAKKSLLSLQNLLPHLATIPSEAIQNIRTFLGTLRQMGIEIEEIEFIEKQL